VNSPLLILGADGYVGWPLVCELLSREPHRPMVLVDNGLRRRLVEQVGGQSVTPIHDFHARVEAARRIFGATALTVVELDVAGPELDALIGELKPAVVYHLAQQCSAPWSMRGPEEAVFTVENNEGGNLRLLFSMRKHVPNAHLVKLGTFGEYAKAGIDVAEGYFRPTYNGKEASAPMPYPRESDDVYHISKINDSNYISLACRKWGLAVTDVMQSTIYGLRTAAVQSDPALSTRFDQDSCFGTVLNRFVAQTVVGHPMTVYGTGLQRTGLMYLGDSVNSLASLADRRPEPGTHHVINHVTERNWCVLEIAEHVAAAASVMGLKPTIERGTHNPRAENDSVKASHAIEAHYVASEVAHTGFDRAIPELLAEVHQHRGRVLDGGFVPTVQWAR
jgi:UDP-sulfoquinovose synthase